MNKLGTCKFAYVAHNNEDEAVLLNDEQINVINEIRRKVYDNEQRPLLDGALLEEEITEKEYNEALKEWESKENRTNRYHKFISEVSERLGIIPEVVTLLVK